MTTKTSKTFYVLWCGRSDWDGYVFYDEWMCCHGSTKDIDKAAHFPEVKDALAYSDQWELAKIDEKHFKVHKVTQMQVVQELEDSSPIVA